MDAQVERVLAVTHGGVAAMISSLLGLDPRHYLAFDVPYAGLAVIDLVDGKGVFEALECGDWRLPITSTNYDERSRQCSQT